MAVLANNSIEKNTKSKEKKKRLTDVFKLYLNVKLRHLLLNQLCSLHLTSFDQPFLPFTLLTTHLNTVKEKKSEPCAQYGYGDQCS